MLRPPCCCHGQLAGVKANKLQFPPAATEVPGSHCNHTRQLAPARTLRSAVIVSALVEGVAWLNLKRAMSMPASTSCSRTSGLLRPPTTTHHTSAHAMAHSHVSRYQDLSTGCCMHTCPISHWDQPSPASLSKNNNHGRSTAEQCLTTGCHPHLDACPIVTAILVLRGGAWSPTIMS